MNTGWPVFAEPSEACLAAASSEEDSSSWSSYSSDTATATIAVSGQHFGTSDFEDFNKELVRLSERLEFLSCESGETDEVAMDSIEEEIAQISDEVEDVLMLSQSQSCMDLKTRIVDIRSKLCAVMKRMDDLEQRADYDVIPDGDRLP